jgi:hypothetical protein
MPRPSRVLGLALSLFPGALLVACTTTVIRLDGGDAGAASLDDADAGAAAAADRVRADASEAVDAGGESLDCGAPGNQVFTSPLGPFCPFQAGGVFRNCAVGEHCCEYAEDAGAASSCSAGPTACGVEIASGFDWRCDEGNDCPSGQVCCFAGAIAPHPVCAGQYSTSPTVHSTACRIGACAAGETRTCGSSADCAPGATCAGMRLRGKHFGFCQP